VDRATVLALLSRRVRGDRMFPFVEGTWNPVTGCLFLCEYCWARRMARRFGMDFSPRLHPERLRRRFGPGTVVFVCDFGDLFGPWIPREWIEAVLSVVRGHPRTLFLLLTKNPGRYHEFAPLPSNALAGATIETDLDDVGKRYSPRAPPVSQRLEALARLDHPHKFVSIEPVLRFSDPERFAERIAGIGVLAAAVGYDNHGLVAEEDQPSEEQLRALIEALERKGILVVPKTVRRRRAKRSHPSCRGARHR